MECTECDPPLIALKEVILMTAKISCASAICKTLDQMFYLEDEEEFCPRMSHTQSILISALDDLDDNIWDF